MLTFVNSAFPWIIGGVLLAAQISMIIPILPALWIQWAAVLVYGLVTGFTTAGWIIFGVITVLVIAGGLVDNVLMGAKAKIDGASWIAVAVAFIGAVAGSLVWPPLGGLVFAVVGIFAVEFIRIKDWRKALNSTKSLAIGFGWAWAIRFFIGLLVMAAWLLWLLVF